jgi:hypothetical protein
LSGIRLGIPSGEQLGAGVGEFDVGPGFVPPQPALRYRALDAGAVFGQTAAGGEKGLARSIKMRPSWTASAALAISITFRTAAPGSLNGLGSANFMGFVLGGDVGDVDQVFFEAVTVEDIAARAFQIDAARLPGLPFVRRQPFARVPQRVFARRPIPLITPRLKISLGSIRQKHPPGAFEIGAGLIEGRGGAFLLLARLRSRIETAS